MTDDLALRFSGIPVGRITEPFESDRTWHGNFELAADQVGGERVRRVISYIAFCSEWNERNRSADPPEANEFDHYSDLIGSGLWTVTDAIGKTTSIVDAPVFFSDGEISWRIEHEGE